MLAPRLWGLFLLASALCGACCADAEWVQPQRLGNFDGVAFVKLGKVGGTTLRSAIESLGRIYGYPICDLMYPCGKNLSCLKTEEPPSPRNCTIWTDHGVRNAYFFYGLEVMERWVPNQLRIVIVRNPISSAMSYTYFKKYKTWRGHMEMVTSGEDIVGIKMPILYIGRREGLNAALKNMEDDFDIVGVTERMDEVITLVCLYMGWDPALFKMENKMVSSSRPRFEDHNQEVQEYVKTRTHDDQILYHKAEQLLDKLIEKVPKDVWNATLSRFRNRNAEALQPIEHSPN